MKGSLNMFFLEYNREYEITFLSQRDMKQTCVNYIFKQLKRIRKGNALFVNPFPFFNDYRGGGGAGNAITTYIFIPYSKSL